MNNFLDCNSALNKIASTITGIKPQTLSALGRGAQRGFRNPRSVNALQGAAKRQMLGGLKGWGGAARIGGLALGAGLTGAAGFGIAGGLVNNPRIPAGGAAGAVGGWGIGRAFGRGGLGAGIGAAVGALGAWGLG